MRDEQPAYADLVDPRPLSAAEAQRLLPPGTVVFEYLLGRTRSHLWVIRHDRIEHAALPGRREIERLVRPMLDAVRRRETDYTPADALAADAGYWRNATAVASLLLAPVATLRRDGKIVVVPDGVLHLVPFAALPAPGRTRGGRPTPLIVVAEVTTVPSLSVLAVARQSASVAATTGGVAIIADPVYNLRDDRVPRDARARIAARPRAPGETFKRLRGTTQEADIVARIAAGSRVTTFEGFKASRAELSGAALQPYRIVHFATHGVFDGRRPERSGLVLSLYDRRGQPADGFLQLLDVYRMSLSAELVVMSACDTARGRGMNGEGVIGLTRGFLLAGAAQVVSTHWKVSDDGSTPQLMEWFYDALLRQKLPAAAALRYAQRRMWDSSQWSAPYYWGAFTLYALTGSGREAE